jgi:hypothetical protein
MAGPSSFLDSSAVVLFAHGIVGRADLPISNTTIAVAAVVVLVVSFIALAVGWSQPKLERVRERPLVRIPLAVEVLLGALGVFAFAVTVYAGIAGADSQSDNLAPTAVYVGFWIGVPFATLLFGNVFRLVSPWRAVGRATGWVGGRLGALPEPLPYPDRLGHWPAAAGILAFTICELCWASAKDPGPVAVLMLVYLAIQFVGMSLYGVDAWTRRGDAFGVWFGLLARLSVFGRRGDGRLVLRPPVAGAAGFTAIAGTTALLLTGIGSTAFDGAREGPVFNDPVGSLQDAFQDLGASIGFGLELAFVVCLLITIGVMTVIWSIALLGMPRRTLRLSHAALGRRFVHSLIPIAAAYLVAHYFSALVYNGQALWALVSDPLGDGSDLFGGAGSGIDYSVVSATTIAWVQVSALVIGHVSGLVLAHDRALAVYGSPRVAIASQVVMLVVMVLFTVLGLWLLSEALNQ